MGVTGTCERSLLDRGRLGTGIPEQYLTRVCAADNKIGMEWREFGSEYVGLRMEDVFGSVVHVQIPDLDKAVWVVWSGWVFGVGCEDELWELRNCQSYSTGEWHRVYYLGREADI